MLDTGGSIPGFTTWCGGTEPLAVVQTQSGGVDVAVVAFRDLVVTSSGSIRLLGSRPAVIAGFGDATMDGTLNANASGGTPGGAKVKESWKRVALGVLGGAGFRALEGSRGRLGRNGRLSSGAWAQAGAARAQRTVGSGSGERSGGA